MSGEPFLIMVLGVCVLMDSVVGPLDLSVLPSCLLMRTDAMPSEEW